MSNSYLHRLNLRTRIPKLIAAILWTVAGAVGMLLLNDIWEKPKPVVELASVEVTTQSSYVKTFLVPMELRTRMSTNDYWAERHTIDYAYREADPSCPWCKLLYDGECGFEDAQVILRQIKQRSELGNSTVQFLNALAEDINGQSLTLPLEQRRDEFLKKWLERTLTDEPLQNIAMTVANMDPQYHSKYESKKPETPTELKVQIGTTVCSMVYHGHSEITAAQRGYGGRNLSLALTDQNTQFNMFAEYDPDLIIAYLKSVRAKIKESIEGSQSIRTAFERVMSNSARAVIKATCILCNRGSSPVAVRESATLLMKCGKEGTQVAVPMEPESADSRPILLARGEAVKLFLKSSETCQEIITRSLSILERDGWTKDKPLTESHFAELAAGDNIRATIVAYRIGMPLESSKTNPSNEVIVAYDAGKMGNPVPVQ